MIITFNLFLVHERVDANIVGIVTCEVNLSHRLQSNYENMF